MSEIVKVDVFKKFKNFELKVNFSVNEGEKVLIQGPNGSGKTTLLYLIYGVLNPDSGYVRVFNKNPTVELRKSEMYMLEEYLIFLENASLKENLEFITSLRDFNINKTEELINKFDLPLYKKPYQLSSGQRRLFKLALAFSSEAKLLLLDEPTSNLDIENSKIVKDIIREYNGTVIFASHDLLLKESCDKTIYLRTGKIERIEIK
ncbi:ATP-binding cassette domain-containing protein [Saccharolobus islandicus]|uniref:ABC-type antimicrobial peptide transport system,ATPase component n=3 Tax=Saccharolobus islandicus TaxID=43080 RepID=M9U6B8_SACIS|nr:ABC transporter ATP-binding protein [Sulfolobus islandicus]ADX82497.1 ABC transporter related protein [Sulfolobus islandicus HVE10/4]ADX85129.1 ABC transporter related protein [Sulfolobus islandicus REY15A]AGJ62519.1 ABC-type antimicrobial peptide transport system,ATPase component [Sulfolobus islandicus LAL14/1]WCM36218.1 ATP-binding cassette domain-containing protein [Sulfolobus islandicus]